MKKSELTEIKLKVIGILPMLQSDLWKSGKIPEIKDHRDCSKIIKLLEGECLIKRTKYYDKDKKISTFRIEKLNGSSPCSSVTNKDTNTEKKKKKNNKKKNKYQALLGKDNKFSPCTGCTEESCQPATCNNLMNWL